ncbi:glycosyltransferase [Spirosoma sp. HMF4905]|uniref:Glycosyltransferase n=1 Tax=Spirosoma arboris TaxID=2682092 RepID=A0A7K1SGC3_9BACT|nr:glycosyltransferase family 2 protein [Spirosoma arboris]MVM32869.1 glycosyltransferase [Spirosoma arboris]
MPDLSIIIVNYKTPQLILDCLTSVYNYTQDISFEIVVVDNQSGDKSQSIIQTSFPATHWFQMGYNSGFARANNFGIRQAQGRYILLLNSDTLLIDNILAHCVQALDAQPDVAAVSAIQLQANRQIRPNLYTTFGQMRRAFYILPGAEASERLLNKLMPDTQYDDPNQVDWLSGAFLMTRASVIAKAGMLDESFFMYGEDVEWGYRLGQQGRLLLLRDQKFVHLEYGSNENNQQHVVTHINRFKPQIQVSQLLWVRKQYGIGAYLVLILHYIGMIPIVFIWKMAVNLRERRLPWVDLDNQWAFTKQVGIFLRFFWKTLLNEPGFYKV